MIITKTPLRISFAGGGTDLSAFYLRTPGAVVSATIDLYVYLAVHRFFDPKFVLKYSKTEVVDAVDEIEHPLIRECLKRCEFEEKIEVTSFADIPSRGSGLGSSSAFAVGLIKALHAFLGKNATAEACASMACEVEIDRLGEPIGKQDQYATAFGGFNYIRFNQDETVHVEPIVLDSDGRRFLEDHLVMFYTGITRSAGDILNEMRSNTQTDEDRFASMCKMRDMADELRELMMDGNYGQLGEFLHRGWLLKRNLASKISSDEIDELYQAGIDAGALGGKLLGAGGGGFFLFFCPPEKRQSLLSALSRLRPLRPLIDQQGTRLICAD